jgi:hypothetical protein
MGRDIIEQGKSLKRKCVANQSAWHRNGIRRKTLQNIKVAIMPI